MAPVYFWHDPGFGWGWGDPTFGASHRYSGDPPWDYERAVDEWRADQREGERFEQASPVSPEEAAAGVIVDESGVSAGAGVPAETFPPDPALRNATGHIPTDEFLPGTALTREPDGTLRPAEAGDRLDGVAVPLKGGSDDAVAA
jgi:hypothetical protein